MGYLEAALANFNCAIDLNPNYAWAIAHRGETYRQMKRYEKALVDFSRSLTLKPGHAWTLAHRGASHYKLKYYQHALAEEQATTN